MAWLIPLDVRGRGSPHIEALSSYVLRLADLVAASPGLLLTLAFQRIDPATPSLGLFRSPISAIVRPGEVAKSVVEAVGRGMSQPSGTLESMTFLATIDALDHSNKNFASHLRWCAACFEEWKDAELPVYYKLIWQLTHVEDCEIHDIRLRDQCGACGATQDTFESRSSLLRCIRCSSDLSRMYPSDRHVSGGNQDAIDLVESIAKNAGVRFPKGSVARFVGELFNRAWANEAEGQLYKLLPRDECLRIATGEARITLVAAMRISHRLRVPLVDLLAGEVAGTNLAIHLESESSPTPLAPIRRSRLPSETSTAVRLRNVLQGYRTRNEFPSPLQVARELRISIDALREKFPVEANRVARDYLHYCTITKQRSRTQLIKSRSSAIGTFGSPGRKT